MNTVVSASARMVAMLAIAAVLVTPTGQQTTRLLVQNIVQLATDNVVPALTPAAPTHDVPTSTPPKEKP